MNGNPADPLASIAKSATQPLKLEQTDPALAEAVNAFVAEKQAEISPEEKKSQEAQSEQTPGPQNVVIPPNTDFDREVPPQDLFAEQALVDTNKVEIPEEEKVNFLKALLNDEPFKLPIKLFNGQLTIELRARTNHEQRRVFDIVDHEVKEKRIDETDLAKKITRFQQLCAAIMVERINGKLFSEITLEKGSKLEDDAKKLIEFVDKNIDGMTQNRWTAIFNAMRIFENKCARLSSEAINENFWNPRASV